ncbi:heavy metal transporter [Streptomyces sp. NPDC047000]|uniref:heavy metal transporter n=1 Tax=Streptomyces sp. NPDC047000 TaxID=3155474 RepID=UPI0033E78AAB
MVLAAIAGYVVVQYVTGGAGGPGCKVVSAGRTGPVYEFSPEQAVNAATIAAVGTGRGMPQRAVTIALATALQESGLRNIESGDRDSLGLFQQRPSQGWGTEKQIMDPSYAAGIFYEHLVRVPGYTGLPLTVAAQRVQRSGYPEAYAKHETDATLLSAALTGHAAATLTCQGRPDAVTAATGPDAVREALVRDFGRDAFQEAAAEVNGATPKPTPVPSASTGSDGRTVTVPVPKATHSGASDTPTISATSDATGKAPDLKETLTTDERGWQLAQWAVANASALHIRRVSYAGREWTAGSTDSQWIPVPAATGTGTGTDTATGAGTGTGSQGSGGAGSTTAAVKIVTGQ